MKETITRCLVGLGCLLGTLIDYPASEQHNIFPIPANEVALNSKLIGGDGEERSSKGSTAVLRYGNGQRSTVNGQRSTVNEKWLAINKVPTKL